MKYSTKCAPLRIPTCISSSPAGLSDGTSRRSNPKTIGLVWSLEKDSVERKEITAAQTSVGSQYLSQLFNWSTCPATPVAYST